MNGVFGSPTNTRLDVTMVDAMAPVSNMSWKRFNYSVNWIFNGPSPNHNCGTFPPLAFTLVVPLVDEPTHRCR